MELIRHSEEEYAAINYPIIPCENFLIYSIIPIPEKVLFVL